MEQPRLDELAKKSYGTLCDVVGGIHTLPWEELPPIGKNAHRQIVLMIERELQHAGSGPSSLGTTAG